MMAGASVTIQEELALGEGVKNVILLLAVVGCAGGGELPSDGGGVISSHDVAPVVNNDASASSMPHVDTLGTDTKQEVPMASDFGEACTENADCESGWCVQSATPGEHVCSQACISECPAGYLCADVSNVATDATFVCKPVGCASSPEICDGLDNDCDGQTDEGLTDEPGCVAENKFGTCIGTATCHGAEGWSCAASEPQPEECDGLDNDCDGLTDEDFIDTDVDGTADCMDSDDDNDGDLDEVDCAPLDAAIYEGTSCDDGNLCTLGDMCHDGVCAGTSDVVCFEDTTDCMTTPTCNPATGVCESTMLPYGTTCNDGNPCTSTDYCDTGLCKGTDLLPAGTLCNTNKVCTDAGECTHCGDVEFCPTNYQCIGGACVYGPQDSAD